MLAFAIVYVSWGSSYLAIRVAVESFPPFLMAGVRFSIAGSVLYAWLRWRGVRAPTAAEWRHAALAGTLMLALGNGLVTWAEETLPSSLAALLIAGVPVHLALLEWLRPGGLRPRASALVGIVLGSLGMLLLVVPARSDTTAPPLPIAAMLVSGVCWALGTLQARRSARHAHVVMSAAQQMLVGGAVLLAVGALSGEAPRFDPARIDVVAVSALAYLVVFGSILAFTAYGWLALTTTSARLSTFAYVNPLIAVFLGWLLLGEVLSARALAGGAVILAAVAAMSGGGAFVSSRAAPAWRWLASAVRARG